jgi:predicted lipoprotein with Yx(FWY)xxD motif
MRRLAAAVLVLAAASLAAACGQDDVDATESTATPSSAKPPASGSGGDGSTVQMTSATTSDGERASKRRRPGKKVKIVKSVYGKVLADRKGEAFYIFDKESSSKPRCYGGCADAWPPVVTKGRPRAGKGAKQKLLGTTKRRKGKRQVTYDGRPLYYYVDDSPGVIRCQNVFEYGGLWLLQKRSGKPLT